MALEAAAGSNLAIFRVDLESRDGRLKTVGLRAREGIDAMEQALVTARSDTGALTGFECVGCWVNGAYGRISTVVVRALTKDVTATPDRITGIEVSTGADQQGAPRDGYLTRLVNFDVVVRGDSAGGTVAIDLRGGSLRADSLHATVSGATSAVGVRVTDARLSLRDSEFTEVGSAASSAGIRTVDADAEKYTYIDVVGSRIHFGGSSIDGTADATVRLAYSELPHGSIAGSADVRCFGVYGGDYASSGLDACP